VHLHAPLSASARTSACASALSATNAPVEATRIPVETSVWNPSSTLSASCAWTIETPTGRAARHPGRTPGDFSQCMSYIMEILPVLSLRDGRMGAAGRPGQTSGEFSRSNSCVMDILTVLSRRNGRPRPLLGAPLAVSCGAGSAAATSTPARARARGCGAGRGAGPGGPRGRACRWNIERDSDSPMRIFISDKHSVRQRRRGCRRAPAGAPAHRCGQAYLFLKLNHISIKNPENKTR